KYDLFRIKRSINIHIAKLEINEKQEVEIMEKVVRKKGLSLNAKIIIALLISIVLALSLLLSMVDTINIINTIKEKFTLDADKKEFFVIMFFYIFICIFIFICLMSIRVLKNKALLLFIILTLIFISAIIASIFVFNFTGLFFLIFLYFIFAILYSVLINIKKGGEYEAYERRYEHIEDLFQENDIVKGSMARRFGTGIYE
ncbi:hypothetical protein CINS5437_07650, partial [Campylobacter insulaenigrae]